MKVLSAGVTRTGGGSSVSTGGTGGEILSPILYTGIGGTGGEVLSPILYTGITGGCTTGIVHVKGALQNIFHGFSTLS
jgi:hypothetical protein